MALQLGYPHPDYMLQCLTARQLKDWFNYYEIEPFGDIRDEFRHGRLMALTANINRDTKLKPNPWTYEDYMNPSPEKEPERKLSNEELEAYAKKVFGA